ncbi:type II toxin-antitoxin system Phd/YefM family antitoxin [Kluyvera cryocrescens]|uniref:type II toxin-antitoxin system Phd/YefM family antitoxin n=1 Tax=Kluyvera cryocrescens TaxID=580 RepID=UPI00296AA7E9|nr:plasmid stabilization protein [Kluyvera cryocrescens]MEB7558783.1 plasmid stabilization protein [Kluyvera cryocrescens]
MAYPIHCTKVTSITEFKRDPLGTVESADGEAVAVFNRSAPAFYLVPLELFEELKRDADAFRALKKS